MPTPALPHLAKSFYPASPINTAKGFKKWCAYIGALSRSWSKVLGGVGGGEKSGFRKFFWGAGVAAAGIGWIEVELLSLRIAGVSA